MATVWNAYAKNGVKLQCHAKSDRSLSECCEKVWRFMEYYQGAIPHTFKIEGIEFPEESLIKKWADYCNKCGFLVTFSKGVATFKTDDYDGNLVKLFLGFTVFRYVIEKKRVVLRTFKVKEEMPKLDLVRALQMALILENVSDGHRGLFYTSESLPILINRKYIKSHWKNPTNASEINDLFNEHEGSGRIENVSKFKGALPMYKFMREKGNLYREND